MVYRHAGGWLIDSADSAALKQWVSTWPLTVVIIGLGVRF